MCPIAYMIHVYVCLNSIPDLRPCHTLDPSFSKYEISKYGNYTLWLSKKVMASSVTLLFLSHSVSMELKNPTAPFFKLHSQSNCILQHPAAITSQNNIISHFEYYNGFLTDSLICPSHHISSSQQSSQEILLNSKCDRCCFSMPFHITHNRS